MGFAPKKLWDWMQLLIVPSVLAGGTLWFNAQQANTNLTLARQQHESDQQIAVDQQEESTLTTHINDIGDLLTTNNLRFSQPGDEVRVIARAKTFASLKRLNGDRKGELIQFLYEAHLIGYTFVDMKSKRVVQAQSIVNLYGVDARYADLAKAYLEGANLEGVNLDGIDLSRANLSYTKIAPAQLSMAYSLENTPLPNSSQIPSKSWPIPRRDAKCVRWVGGTCISQQDIDKSPVATSPPPYPRVWA